MYLPLRKIEKMGGGEEAVTGKTSSGRFPGCIRNMTDPKAKKGDEMKSRKMEGTNILNYHCKCPNVRGPFQLCFGPYGPSYDPEMFCGPSGLLHSPDRAKGKCLMGPVSLNRH